MRTANAHVHMAALPDVAHRQDVEAGSVEGERRIRLAFMARKFECETNDT